MEIDPTLEEGMREKVKQAVSACRGTVSLMVDFGNTKIDPTKIMGMEIDSVLGMLAGMRIIEALVAPHLLKDMDAAVVENTVTQIVETNTINCPYMAEGLADGTIIFLKINTKEGDMS